MYRGTLVGAPELPETLPLAHRVLPVTVLQSAVAVGAAASARAVAVIANTGMEASHFTVTTSSLSAVPPSLCEAVVKLTTRARVERLGHLLPRDLAPDSTRRSMSHPSPNSQSGVVVSIPRRGAMDTLLNASNLGPLAAVAALVGAGCWVALEALRRS